MKVALFSLGNMCTHASCSQVLLSLGLPATLQRLSASPDAVVKKYCARIQVSFEGSFQQATALLLHPASPLKDLSIGVQMAICLSKELCAAGKATHHMTSCEQQTL